MTLEKFIEKYPFKDGEEVWYHVSEGVFIKTPIQLVGDSILLYDEELGKLHLTTKGTFKEKSEIRFIFHLWEEPKIETVKPRGKDNSGNVLTTNDLGYYYFDSEKIRYATFSSIYAIIDDEENCFKYEKDALAYAEPKWCIEPSHEAFKFGWYGDPDDYDIVLTTGEEVIYGYDGVWRKGDSCDAVYKPFTPKLKTLPFDDIRTGDWIAHGYLFDDEFTIGLVTDDKIVWVDEDGCFSEQLRNAFKPNASDHLFKITKADDK